MLEVMLITFVIGGVLVAGTLALRAKSPSTAAQGQAQALVEADKALLSFSIAKNRLPCPDIDRDGLEDCGSGLQKGWLPYRTLLNEGASFSAGVVQLRYLVQRAATDLAAATDVWQPIKSTLSGAYSGTRTFVPANIGIPDLCVKLNMASAVSLQMGHAQVASTPARAVAYALVHPGSKDEDGDGDLFDAENTTLASNVVAASEREWKSSVYDDRVIEKKYSDLAQQLNCAQLNTSINMVSLAAEAVDQVHSQAITNTLMSSVLTAVNGVLTVIAGVKTYLAATKLATAVGYATTAAGLLSGAIAGCAVIIGCAEIPHAVASVVAAAVSVAASTAAVVASAVSTGLQVTATGLTLSAAIVAGVSTTSNIDISAAVAQALTQKQKATTNKNSAYTDWQTAVQKEAALNSAVGPATFAVYNTARNAIAAANKAGVPAGTRSVNDLDSAVDVLNARAYDWYIAERNYADADDAYKRAKDATSGGGGTANANSTAAMTALQKEIDAETDPVKKQALIDAKATLVNATNNASTNAQQLSQINAQIADLDTQIAGNPINVADLQSLRATLVTQRSNLSLSVADALAYKNSQDTARNAAKTTYYNARTEVADAALVPYSVKTCTTSGSPAVETCKTENKTYDGRADMGAAISGLFDESVVLPGNVKLIRPDNGVYFKWRVQQQQTVASQTAYNSAVDSETQAISAYNSLASLSTGTTGTGTYTAPWNGADDILKQADKKADLK